MTSTMTTRVYSPRPGAAAATRGVPLPPVPAIEGNSFAILTNGWQGMLTLADHLARRLKDSGANDVFIVDRPDLGIGAVRPETDEFLDDLASKVAGAISGLGNCGSCTSWSVSDSLQMERRGIRSGHVVVDNFKYIAKALAKAQDQTDHPIVILPPKANEMSSEELAGCADTVLDAVFGLKPTS
jgi:hypothetical protein